MTMWSFYDHTHTHHSHRHFHFASQLRFESEEKDACIRCTCLAPICNRYSLFSHHFWSAHSIDPIGSTKYGNWEWKMIAGAIRCEINEWMRNVWMLHCIFTRRRWRRRRRRLRMKTTIIIVNNYCNSRYLWLSSLTRCANDNIPIYLYIWLHVWY